MAEHGIGYAVLSLFDYDVDDFRLYEYLRLLKESEGMHIEPSSCAAFIGPCSLLQNEDSRKYLKIHGLTDTILKNSTHICWATGGSLVPDEVWEQYVKTFLK